MKSGKSYHTGAPTGLLAVLLGLICFSVCLPLTVSAAENEATGWGIWATVGRFFNLGVVIAALVYVLRKPFAQFFVERKLNIQRSLEEAQQARITAEAKLAEMEKRMAGLDCELEQIKEKAGRDAEEEKKRAALVMEQESERIISVAQREAEALVRAATMQLRQEAAKLAVELAEKKISSEMASDIDDRLVDVFMQQLGRPR